MPIKVDCPNCGHNYSLADTQLGKLVKCKSCSEPFEVRPVKSSVQSANGARKTTRRDEDEEDDRPSRKAANRDEDDRPVRRRSRDDDDDDPPARGRSRDEDEDDRPARRRSREDVVERPVRRGSRDDDEDDRPARKRRRDDDDYEDERPKKRRKARSGGMLWLWIGRGVGGAVLLLGLIVAVVMIAGGSVSKANYERIKQGMSPAEVRAILGSPSEENGALGWKGMNWKSGSNEITCLFAEDKLIMKAAKFGDTVMADGEGGAFKVNARDFRGFPRKR